MKKLLLLFMLLPLIGFTQTEPLVKWHGIGVQPQPWIPTTQPSYFNNSQNSITADNITGVGINFYYNSNNGFEGTGWSTSSSNPDLGKYFLLKISPKEGYQLNLTQFSFNYMGNNKKMRISYSKSEAFDNPTIETVNNINSYNTSTNYTMTLTGDNAHIVYGESLYIRIYGYQNNGSASTAWRLNDSPAQSANSSGSGPAIYGTISPYATSGVTANADTATTPESTAVNINVTGNDNAVSTTIASVAVTQQSANGSATVQPDKTISFTPNNGYTGTTNFQYTITGADGSTSAAMVTVTVNPFTAPTANADSVTTGQNIPVTINVLSNDVAGDGTINSVTILSAPAHGTATLNGNNIVYTPNSSYTGSDSLTYKITDSNNKTANATVTVSIVPVQAPTAQNDNAATAKNTSITLDVIANDSPGNSAITTIAITGNPSHGTVTVNSDKTLTYDPTNGYTGTDSFSYTITDAYNASSTATVNMTVLNPNVTGTLCGTYYVGTNGDFTTITAAVNHLNSYGVACPVTFILKDALYNNASGETFPITINNFTGSSAVNTVTFKPKTGVNVSIEASNAIVNYNTQPVPAVFKLNGADNIVFDGSNTTGGSTRNLTIKNKSNINYTHRTVIWVASNGTTNGATNNTIKYCNLRQENKNSGSNFCVGIYSGSNTSGSNNAFSAAGADNANLTVLNNDFMNVKQGVYINGGSSIRTTNVVITQNDLGSEDNTETIIQPAYISNVNGFEYSKNYIYNLYRDNNSGSLVSTGLYVAGNSSSGTITKNEMKNLTKATSDDIDFAGIVLASTNTSNNIVVSNNFILNVAGYNNGGLTGNGYGISVLSGGGYKIYNNTVVLNTPQGGTGQGYSAALRVTSTSNIDVRNNIFVNNQTNTTTRRCSILVSGNISMFSNLDYNVLYSVDKTGYIGTNPTDANNSGYKTLLSGWQTATGKDAHSTDVSPVFVSASDIHLDSNNNSAINNTGTPIASVTEDIDGQVRNTTTPDMGADEFGPIEMPTPGTGTGIYCDNSVTWNGTAWIGGEPTANTDVIFAGDFTQHGGTLYACSVFVVDGASVLFESNSNAIVTHSVNVEDGSTLTFESSCNLIQIEDTANQGTVNVKRDSSMIKRLDYTIWSSPVTGTQSLLDFSPLTLTNRFYGFNVADNVFLPIEDPANTLFEKGHGYLIRVANNHPSNVPTVYHGEFTGTPNNGTIRVAMEYTNGNESYNMVGNPYASPININKFIDANIDNIEGTLWVWRKTNDPTKTTYCTITKIGWTANSAPGGGGSSGNGGNELIGNPFNIISDGVLNTGQGFFVRALNDNELIFRNNMRESVNFNNFFRTENTNEEVVNEGTNRYWLNVVTEDESVFSQILVAHTPLASEGFDNGYDGKAFLDGGVSLYTMIPNGAFGEEDVKLSIQSRNAFTVNDTVKVGFKTDVAGTFSITIDHMDGIFEEGQAIYLVDKFTNTTYNLAEGNYSFNSEIGTFEDRFEIIYTIEAALGTDNPQVAPSEVVVYQNNKELSVKAPKNIESVVIYDLLGKVLYQNPSVDSNEFTTTLNNIQQQIAIVTITLENNQVVSKKVMIN